MISCVARLDLSAYSSPPVAPDQSARIYRTGLWTLRSNGEIEIWAIRPHVKVRGVRIELGEIESLLASMREYGRRS